VPVVSAAGKGSKLDSPEIRGRHCLRRGGTVLTAIRAPPRFFERSGGVAAANVRLKYPVLDRKGKVGFKVSSPPPGSPNRGWHVGVLR